MAAYSPDDVSPDEARHAREVADALRAEELAAEDFEA